MKYWPELIVGCAVASVLALAVAYQGKAATDTAQLRSGNAGPAATPPDAKRSSNTVAIRGARVFDGNTDSGVTTVLVRDGKIAEVGVDVQLPNDVTVVDGSGKTLLPGLFDAHVHAWGNAQRDMLRFGVTTALDMHGMTERLPALRKQRESTTNGDQADLWAAGAGVTVPGGHGTQFGYEAPTVDAKTDVDAFVDARVKEGSDFIKLIIEPGSAKWKLLPTLSADQARAAVEAAHRQRLLAVAHVSKQEDVQAIIAAGADGLVHVFADAAIDDALVANLRKRDAFVTPTLAVLASSAGSGESKTLAESPQFKTQLSAEQARSLMRDFGNKDPALLQRALDNVRRLHQAGVTILAGSDALNPGTAHGVSLHHELELLVRAGLTPTQALVAATSAPAQRFGITDRGRIAPGQRADMVLVDGNPLQDIRATRDIKAVWKNGQQVTREGRASAQSAPSLSAHTLISDFDGDAIAAHFGSWHPTTDEVAGGASVVRHALVTGGAEGSRGALQVTGEVKPGFAYPWSGVIFFPGAQPMQAVDASARKELVFQVRGDGRTYRAMVFSGPSMQGTPAVQTFVAGPEWQQVRLPLSAFAHADLKQLLGIAFAAGQPTGTFEFRIDTVELR